MGRPDWLDPAWVDVRATRYEGWDLKSGDGTPLGSITRHGTLPSWSVELPNLDSSSSDGYGLYASETDAARYLIERAQHAADTQYWETHSAPTTTGTGATGDPRQMAR